MTDEGTRRGSEMAVAEEIGVDLTATIIFAMHVVVGAVLFALIAGVALLLYIANHWAQERWSLPGYFTGIITCLELGLFLVDCICFAFFVVIEGVKFCRRVGRGWRGD